MSYLLKYHTKYLDFNEFSRVVINEINCIKIDKIKGKEAASRLGNRFVKLGDKSIRRIGEILLDKNGISAYIEIFNDASGKLIFGFYVYPHIDIHIEHEESNDNVYKIYLNRLSKILEGELYES